MRTRDVSKTDPRLLAKLMDLDPDPERLWQPEELGAILRHQLSAPVEFDLSTFEPGTSRKVATVTASHGLLLKSFHDLLHHPNPPIELLVQTKQFAKASANHPDSPLPRPIAMVLYYASIVVAMTRCSHRITQLDDAELTRGLQWAIAEPWVDEQTRALVREGLKFLHAEQDGAA